MQARTVNLVISAGLFIFLAVICAIIFLFLSKNLTESQKNKELKKQEQAPEDIEQNFSIKESSFVARPSVARSPSTTAIPADEVGLGTAIPAGSLGTSSTILFVGDIMLDRGVEYQLQKNTVFYPFLKIEQFFRSVDFVVGNLEGPIVEEPPYFPDASLRFAFSADVAPALSLANFGLLSLANNHTFNMAESGWQETKEFLSKADINFVGHPHDCRQDFFFEKQGIVFLAFNKTFPFNCSNEKITELVRETNISDPDKFLIIILHWGEEYQLKSNTLQQDLAKQLIDVGADLIIGSHPHVVQEIEEYKGGLIFYSLGNFIFDQYFSKETQQALAVGLVISSEKVIYQLFPLESELSQPFLMPKKEAKDFLLKLAQKSSGELFFQIKDGIIRLSR